MTVKTVDRIPAADLEAIIAGAVDGLDFEHDSSWVRPPECPCHDHGQGCESPQAVSCGCDTRHLTASERETICGAQRTAACVSKLADVPGAFRCLGHVTEVGTPPEHVISLDIMVAALPKPDSNGTVGATEAGNSILSVIKARLVPAYILRADRLVKRLTEEAELYEQSAGLTGSSSDSDRQEDTAPWMPKCQWCGDPCKDKRARFCSKSHKQSAYKRRKREQQREG